TFGTNLSKPQPVLTSPWLHQKARATLSVANLKPAAVCQHWSLSKKTNPEKPQTSLWPTPKVSAVPVQVSSKPPSLKKPKPTYSVNRLYYAVAHPTWSRQASRCLLKPATSQKSPTLRYCTN